MIDRFHVQKLVNKNLNKIRLAINIKGLTSRYLLMSNRANLSWEEEIDLELLLQGSPTLRIAHELKEELITIYNSKITPSGGMRQIKKRMQSR